MHAVYKTDRLKERRGLTLRGDENDTSQKKEDARDYLIFSWNEKREREAERTSFRPLYQTMFRIARRVSLCRFTPIY